MKTVELLNVYRYEALGGSIKVVPVSDLYAFVKRIEDRLMDIEDGMSIDDFRKEIKAVLAKLS